MPTLLERGKLVQPALPDVVPIDYIVEHVMRQLEATPDLQNAFNNRLLLLEAKTASGKSITVPAQMAIATSTISRYMTKTVLCTQPRILTTQEIPRELNGSPYFKAQNFVFELGKNLGFQTGPLEQKQRSGGLLFVTLGVLEAHLQLMTAEQICRRYSIIIIDEAHERQLIFDSVITMLKKFYRVNGHRADLPYLILMSATFDVSKYATYFGVSDSGPNVIRVGGATYDIDERWPTNSVPNLFEACSNAVLALIDEEVARLAALSNTRGTTVQSVDRILVFVTGAGEARKLKKLLEKTGISKWPGVVRGPALVFADVVYVDSPAIKNVTRDYLKIMGGRDSTPAPKTDFTFHTDIIITNAVAETGLSLPDLTYVVDCGWSRESEFDPSSNINWMLIGKPAAQSRIMQRRGRIGRKKNGVFVPLYTKATFDLLPLIQMPEIMKLEPTNLILSIIALNGRLGSAAEVHDMLMDVPSRPAMEFSLHKLQLAGMIDANYGITALGKIASKMTSTLTVDALAMVFAGFVWEASLDDLIAMSVLMKWRYGVGSYIGFREDKRQELKKQGKMNELMRQEMRASEKEAIYAKLWGLPHNPQDGHVYPLRALLADDFIEQLFIFRALERQFEVSYGRWPDASATSIQPTKAWASLVKWADSCFLNLPVLLDAYNDYISTKSSLAAAGIDILYGRQHDFVNCVRDALATGAGLLNGPQNLTDRITRLKLCIYHGYKMNLATYDATTNDYVMAYGGQHFNYSFFGSSDDGWKKYDAPFTYRPQRILFYRSAVSATQGKYSCDIDGISVLDGYL